MTRLGETAASCYLPPSTAAGIGQLFRDLIEDEKDGSHLKLFSPIDLLIVLSLCSDELKPISRYSNRLKNQVDSYMESLPIPDKSYLYRKWIKPEPVALIGSAKIDDCLKEKEAEKLAYQKSHLAMFLFDLAQGKYGRELKDRYRVEVEEIEEKVRDTSLWLLYGLESILEVPNFYYHLKTKCNLTDQRVIEIDNEFKRLSGYIYSLLPNLRYRSALGELIRGIKNSFKNLERYPGEGTIKKLENAGIASINDLVGLKTEDLISKGIQKQYAELIIKYV